jgi:hypothetical protein
MNYNSITYTYTEGGKALSEGKKWQTFANSQAK